jgi:hypothetical protein
MFEVVVSLRFVQSYKREFISDSVIREFRSRVFSWGMLTSGQQKLKK